MNTDNEFIYMDVYSNYGVNNCDIYYYHLKQEYCGLLLRVSLGTVSLVRGGLNIQPEGCPDEIYYENNKEIIEAKLWDYFNRFGPKYTNKRIKRF